MNKHIPSFITSTLSLAFLICILAVITFIFLDIKVDENLLAVITAVVGAYIGSRIPTENKGKEQVVVNTIPAEVPKPMQVEVKPMQQGSGNLPPIIEPIVVVETPKVEDTTEDNNFKESLEHVLKSEGGFVNHPQDPGGATNKGITLKTFRGFFGENKTVEELKAITIDQAGEIYKKNYWDKMRCSELKDGIDFVAFDIAVNSGPARSVKFLQELLSILPINGVINSQVIDRANNMDTRQLINMLCDRRQRFYESLSIFPTFGIGWTRRNTNVREVALNMVR